MVNIFSVGSPTVDHIIPVENNPQVSGIMDNLALTPGCKTRIKAETATQLAEQLSSLQNVVTAPGGSASNTLRAMQQLLEDNFSATLFTMLGTDAKSQMLRKSLYDSGINLAPGVTGINPELQAQLAPSESFIFVYPGGQRAIANYPGTIKDHIHKIQLQHRYINTADVIMLFGSVRETYGEEIFDEILKTRWDSHRPLWFSLPTNHEFVKSHREYFEYLLPSIDVLVGNSEELGALLEQISETVTKSQQQSLKERLEVAKRVLSERAKETGNGNYSINPTSFITEGEDGARIISAEHGTFQIRAAQTQKKVNTLGAGDVTTGVFYACISVGMNPAAAATLAMTAGAITVEHIAAVPDNLTQEIAERDPVNWNVFQQAKEKSRVRSGSGRY